MNQVSSACTQVEHRTRTITGQLLSLRRIFEWYLPPDNKSAFSTYLLQFCFKQGLSTELCTGLVENVVAPYIFNGLDAYGCKLLFDKFLKKMKALKCKKLGAELAHAYTLYSI